MRLDLSPGGRPVHHRDMKTLQKRVVLRAVHCGDLERLVQMDEQITGESRRDWFERRLRFMPGDVRFSLGAEVDGALVGAVLGFLQNGEPGSTERICVIDAVLVDRPFRGREIAAVLLRRLAENLRGLGISRWRMKIAWKQHALDYFLANRGFLPSRPLPQYRRDGSARASFQSLHPEGASLVTLGTGLSLQTTAREHH